MQTIKTKIVHDGAIYWPNGEGYTPCSREYENKMSERDRIYDANFDDGSLSDLPAADYERWHTLNDELHQLQGAGHLGQFVRF